MRAPSKTILTLCALLGLTAAASLYHLRNAYLFSDDFLYFIVYREQPTFFSWIKKPLFGEIVPAVRLTIAGMFDAFGLNYLAYQWLIGIWSVIIIGLAYGLARRLGSSQLASLFGFAFFIFGLPLTNVQQWFSAAIYILPSLICGLITLHILLSVLHTKGRAFGLEALAVLTFSLGLAFFPKTIFQVILIGSILAYANMRTVASGSLLSSLIRAVIVMRGVIAICFVFAIALISVSHGVKLDAPVRVLLDFMVHGLVNSMYLNFFGFGAESIFRRPNQVAEIIGVVVALAGLMALSVRAFGPKILIVWLGQFVYSATVLLLIGTERAVIFGVSAAGWPRYATEAHLFLAILVSLSLSGHLDRPKLEFARRIMLIPATALLAAFLLYATDRVPLVWDTQSVRRYLANLDRDLSEQPKADVRLCDAVLPEVIMPTWTQSLNRVAALATILDGRPIVSKTDCNYTIQPDGKLRRVD